MTRQRIIFLSLILATPIILLALQHSFYHAPELKPTGFTTEEDILYMSYAHQYLDQHPFSFFYSNPFDGNPASPKIYFQPVNFFFAGLMKLGLPPGYCFTFFGILMAIACIYIGIKILQILLPDSKRLSLISLLFTWGGGLTVITGLLISSTSSRYATTNWMDGIYLADPGNGWWALNWGRNLFLPLEAYYHFLFLLGVYFILKQKWKSAVITSLYLSISHPFTGIEFLLIINGWIFFEKLVVRNKSIPYWFWIAIITITGLHFWYYLLFLNNFPEHRQLFNQYTLQWTYSLWVAIPAYCLVGILALSNFRFTRPLKKSLALPHQRLFLGWALISFLLSKHEWFIKPMQPIHFTRGYVWAGLFLFAIPAILFLLEKWKKTGLKKWLLYAAIAIFLSDNIIWTANLLRGRNNIEWEGHITNDTQEVLSFLHKTSTPNDLIIGNSRLVNFLCHVYSKANSWISHPYNTPDFETRKNQMNQFMLSGEKPKEWNQRHILLILDKKSPATLLPSLEKNKIFENKTYAIFTP